MEINAQKCLRTGSNSGIGFIVDAERHFYIDTDRARIVREIFEMYANSATVADIIKYLNDEKEKATKSNSIRTA